MKVYRLGILGLGMIGRVHAYAASSLPFYYDLPFGVRLAVIYNRTYEGAECGETMGFESPRARPRN